MSTDASRAPCEPPYTDPYVRWRGRRGRAIAPAYPIEVLPTGDGGSEAEYGFSTAWTPPIDFLKYVSTQFPALRFDLRYSEIGCAFQGRFIIQGGDVKLDVCRDLVEEETP